MLFSERFEDFRLGENDRIGIESGISYSLSQNGADLDIVTGFGLTKLWNVELSDFDVATRVVNV